MSIEVGTPIVIDNGSRMCKAGFSGEDAPSVCCPAVIGKPKCYAHKLPGISKQKFIGQEALDKKGILTFDYPIKRGVIEDWEKMSDIWHHCFYNQLRVNPAEHPTLLTEAPLNPKKNREKMTEIMFQTFKVPAFYLSIQAVLSLFTSARVTGIVLDSGDGVTHTVPIFEGYSLPHAVERNNFAGRDLTDVMVKLLNEVGLQLKSPAEFEIAREIKEKLAYVALDPKQQMKVYQSSAQNNSIFKLPDGQIISVGSQMFRCSQSLFNPILEGYEMQGIHKLTYNSIIKTDIDIRKQLYGNIVFSGGTTLLQGLPERMVKEIDKLSPSAMRIRLIAARQRKYCVWIGGSIFSSLSCFQNHCITKSQYQEVGPKIVNRKCF